MLSNPQQLVFLSFKWTPCSNIHWILRHSFVPAVCAHDTEVIAYRVTKYILLVIFDVKISSGAVGGPGTKKLNKIDIGSLKLSVFLNTFHLFHFLLAFLNFILHLVGLAYGCRPTFSFLGCLEVSFFGGVVIVIVIVTGWKQSQLLVFLTKDFGWSMTIR